MKSSVVVHKRNRQCPSGFVVLWEFHLTENVYTEVKVEVEESGIGTHKA